MKKQRIPANTGYLLFLLCLVAVAVGGCVAFIFYYKTMQVLMWICTGVLLLSAGFIAWTTRFFVELTEEKITVFAFSKTEFAPGEIEYMEFSFFEDKNGVGYIYLKNGNSAVLPKKLFARHLKAALAEFAAARGIAFRENGRLEDPTK